MKIFFLSIFLCCMTSTFAVGMTPETVVLKIQRDQSTGLEQLALTFGPQKIMLTKNSNFMEQTSSSAQIGLFYREYDDAARTQYKMLYNILRRLKGQKKALLQNTMRDDDYQSPHRVILTLGGNEITPDSIYYQGLYDLLANSATMLVWQKQDSILIQKKGSEILIEREGSEKKGTLTSSKGPTSKFNCRPVSGKRIYCPIHGHGGVYLQ